MLGVETALAVAITRLVEPGTLSLRDALARLVLAAGAHRRARRRRPRAAGRARQPREPLRDRPGGARWVVEAERSASKSRNTPWAGRKLTGRVRHTVLRGEPVVTDGVRPTTMSERE